MIRILLPLVLLTFGQSAFADPVRIQSDVLKETIVQTPEGDHVVQMPAERATPGETILIRLTYLNDGAKPATNVIISNPLPQQLAYVEPREGGAPMVSVDGGKTFAPLADLSVTVDGQSRPAFPDDVTHVRWIIDAPVAPGDSGVVAFATRLK